MAHPGRFGRAVQFAYAGFVLKKLRVHLLVLRLKLGVAGFVLKGLGFNHFQALFHERSRAVSIDDRLDKLDEAARAEFLSVFSEPSRRFLSFERKWGVSFIFAMLCGGVAPWFFHVPDTVLAVIAIAVSAWVVFFWAAYYVVAAADRAAQNEDR